ncbi:uncharacterized protein LOC117187735 [Drosophila miranda]|uniref:uncharacterized protein LOC117187735 n=1 Tax=Drosophila miranda TaxID=7229 RepID=UPI00143FB7BA|nr:uncharacterized protein LOC117187735 [Drosophila miranda]
MFTRIIRNCGHVCLKSGYPSGSGAVPHRVLHNWDRQHAEHEQRKKAIPRLVYQHNPWKYLVTKCNLWKLQWLWDPEFNESEFIEGSKQAAIVVTDIIRQQSPEKMSTYTTPVGLQQITRDMLLSRNDNRLQLIRFQREHLRRAIPTKVARRQSFGRRYAFIDVLFVGLRNTKDFDSVSEVVEVNELIRRMDRELGTPRDVVSVPHRIVFAEIFIRFQRDYTEDARRNFETKDHMAQSPMAALSKSLVPQQPPDALARSTQNPATAPLTPTGRIVPRSGDTDWSVSFYKILTFDVVNYDPDHKRRQR